MKYGQTKSKAKLKHLFLTCFSFLLIALLAACGSSSSSVNSGTTTLTGSIGVASQRSTGLNSLSVSPESYVTSINNQFKHLQAQDGFSTLASEEQPLRGLNAAVLGNVITTLQSDNSKPLFSLTSKSVVAVDKQGTVLASANIQADGSFALEIEDDLWKEAGTIGLLQGYESNNGWVCEKTLDTEDEDGEESPALFGWDENNANLRVQNVVPAGLFNFDPDTGNPTTDEENPQPGDDDFDPKCENADVIETSVTADFTWQTASSVSETLIYETGVGYALDTRDEAQPGFVNVTPLNDAGIMDMEIFKPQGGAPIPMALVISDTDLLKLNSLDDLSKISMPLTPTFDLNAAIRYSNPSEPAQIAVGDSGYAYDPNSTRGGMAYISGTVRGSDGAPEANALVLAMIDSADVIAFNIGISRSDGSYEMLLPATGEELPYYIIALSADETEVGIPANIAKFNGDQNEIRYSINTPLAINNADIQLVSGDSGDTPSGEAGSISGTISVPTGEDVKDAIVFICKVDFSECFDSTQITNSGSQANYQFDGVPEGEYGVAAQKDKNGDNQADLQGFYTQGGTQPIPVPSGSSNIDFSLSVIGGGSNPGGQGTISGTVTAPQGKNVENTEVFACFIENNNCSPDKSGITIIRQSGASAAFILENLAEGNYYIFADKDVDLNNKILEPGDYAGFYTIDNQNPQIVNPGVSNINIQMIEIQGGANPEPDPNSTVLSGTVNVPQGQDLNGAVVYACSIVNDQIDKCEWGNFFQEGGTSLPYSIEVPTGVYVVFVEKDNDGDGKYSPGDLRGCNGGSWPTCKTVAAPESNILVEARVLTEEDFSSNLNQPNLSTESIFSIDDLEHFSAPSIQRSNESLYQR